MIHTVEVFILAYLALGALAGFISGLFGIGAGLVIVPALATLFKIQGISENSVHLAIGTSLATIVISSISSIAMHHRRGAVYWHIVRQIGPSIVIGAGAGAMAASMLPTDKLRIVFGILELAMAAIIAFKLTASKYRVLPGQPTLSIVGVIIGTISSLVGIGGGAITVPFFVWCNVSMQKAVATSSACGLPIAITGTTGFVAAGWHATALPPWSLGYVYGPAFAAIAATSLFFAPLGASLTHMLPIHVLRRTIIGLFMILGIKMLID